MKRTISIIIIILCSICIVLGLFSAINARNKQDTNVNQLINNNSNNNVESTIIENKYNESEMEMTSNIKIIIDDINYSAKLEDNETAKSFINMLPQEFNMSELNGNEKYIYMDNTLPTNASNPKHIETGDIMLYGNNCLVVFYKSFETSYSYTKIGHIENLNNLGNKNITIKFEK